MSTWLFHLPNIYFCCAIVILLTVSRGIRMCEHYKYPIIIIIVIIVIIQGFSSIRNVSLSDDQCLQSSLPIRNGWLGVRSAGILTSSAYLALVAATFPLRMPFWQTHAPQLQIQQCLAIWKTLSRAEEPVTPENCFQKYNTIQYNTIQLDLLRAICNVKMVFVGRLGVRSAGMPHLLPIWLQLQSRFPFRMPFWQTNAPQPQIQQSVWLLPSGKPYPE